MTKEMTIDDFSFVEDVKVDEKPPEEPVLEHVEETPPEEKTEEVIEDEPVSEEKPPEEVIEEPESIFGALASKFNEMTALSLDTETEYDETTFWKSVDDQYKQRIKKEMSLDNPDVEQVLSYIASGGNLAELAQFEAENQIPEDLDLEDGEIQRQIVMSHYMSKGLSEKQVQRLVDDMDGEENLKTEASNIYKADLEEYEKQKKAFIESQETEKREAQERERRSVEEAKTYIKEGKPIFDIELNKKQQDEFVDYLFKPVNYKHTDGNTYKMTQAQINRLKYSNDNPMEYALAIALMEFMEFKNPNLEKKAERKATDKLYSQIIGNKGNKSKSKEAIDDFIF